MSGIGSLLLRALRWRRNTRGRQAPAAQLAPKEVVICVGSYEDCALLDSVLGPGAYEVSFLDSVEGAYAHIANVLPSRVILCMRADDELSLQLLSMLNLDPRTSRISIITCVSSVTAGGDGIGSAGASALAPARADVVMH
jgi:hypothetical protein